MPMVNFKCLKVMAHIKNFNFNFSLQPINNYSTSIYFDSKSPNFIFENLNSNFRMINFKSFDFGFKSLNYFVKNLCLNCFLIQNLEDSFLY